MSVLRDGPWTMTILLGLAGICLIGFGLLLGAFYCDYRRSQDMELTHEALANGELCGGTLSEVVPGRLVLAQQEIDSLRRLATRRMAPRLAVPDSVPSRA